MITLIRSFFIIAVFFGLAAQVSYGQSDPKREGGVPQRPNIILIVADDLGYGDIGSYGQSKVRTPVLDQLAAEGIRFTDFYAGSTVCAPSRASLLTGLHTGHSPVRENPRWTRSGHPVDFVSEDRLFSEVLQDAGYATAMIGKWGMAEDKRVDDLAANPAMPLQQGFDYFFGYRHHSDAHHYYWDRLYENNEVYLLDGNDHETNTGQYTHDLFTDKALEYIGGQSDEKPFLLYLAYTIPHMAITVPEDSKEPYLDLGWPERRLSTKSHYKHDAEANTAFAGMVSRMDRDIGRIKALLEEKGIDENTMILFTSDNGHEYDDGFFDSNGPLRGMKRDLYEGGIRVPTIAWWPGTVPANITSSHVGAFWDVLPTACELAQAEGCPVSDGLSFVPTLLGKKEEQEQHEYLYWEFNESQGPVQAVRSGDWKMLRFLGEPPELYDLRADVGEEHDVALQNPDVVQRLTTQMESARVEHPEFPLELHPRKRPVADRPNIVLIIVDDLGYSDIGAYNPDTFYETPNIDGLASRGAMFLDGYAVNPVCSPSRFAVMTGKHPSRFAATDWFHSASWKPRSDTRYAPAPTDQFLPLEETTLAEMLKAIGYRTAFFGKWHLGEEEKYWPENQGFDINIGGHSKGSPPGGYFSPYDNPRMSSGPTGEYLPERLTSEAINLLHSYEYEDEPYFLMLSYYTVHTPLQAPEQTVEKYRAKQQRLESVGEEFETEEQVWLGTHPERKTRVRQSHPVYAAMIEHLDDNVGRVLHALKELGAENDTIVIFTSDNGGLSTAGGLPTSNRPLRGGKGWLYEGGIRVPFIIAGSRPDTAGARIDAPVSGMDLLPTIVELAGIEPKSEQDIDGRSLVPLLSGESVTEDRPMFWHYPHYGNHGGFPGAAIRRGKYKLIERFEDGRIHLYDLSTDAGERNDLAKAHPIIAATMQEELHDWYKEVGANFLRPMSQSSETPWSPDQ
jgi:arylsulfatase A-like enzyme